MPKVTNRKQYSILVSFMETHKDLAVGFLHSTSAKTTAQNLWQEVAESLNKNGPPERDWAAWKKVWSDYKFQIKRKLRHNKMEMTGTGGGPNKQLTFSDLEEKVIELVNLRAAVDGIAGARSFGGSSQSHYSCDSINSEQQCSAATPGSLNPLENSPHRSNNSPSQEINDVFVSNVMPRRRSHKRALTSTQEHYNLLKQQTKIQEDLYKDIKSNLSQIIESNKENAHELERIRRIQEKRYDLEKKKLKYMEQRSIINDKQFLQDLELKKRKLELQELKLNFQKNTQ